MVAAQGLQEQVSSKVNEIKSLVAGLSSEEASKKPSADEWCVNEVLSHLLGPELGSWKGGIESIVKEDTPLIDLTPGISYYERRSGESTEELLAEFEKEYNAVGEYLGSLTEEQLNRKAHVPIFKETPLGEYPTLAQFAGGIINFHMADHVQQIRALSQ
jgi:hypothetical protein